MSNMAEGEWCAHKDPAARRIISASSTPEIFCLTVILPWEFLAVYHITSLGEPRSGESEYLSLKSPNKIAGRLCTKSRRKHYRFAFTDMQPATKIRDHR